MTHPLAALIAGVPRWSMIEGTSGTFMARATSGEYLHVSDVLAALEAATPPDLVEVERDAEWLRAKFGGQPDANRCDDIARNIRALIALATAQAAQIAGLQRDISTALDDRNIQQTRANTAEADAATLRAEVERLRGAMGNIRELNMTAEDENGHRWANSELIEQEIVFGLGNTHAALEGKHE